MPNNFFEDINSPEGAIVFLDVDGTLRPDGDEEFSPEVLQKIEKLKSKNDVRMVSNKSGGAKKPRAGAAQGVDLKGKKTVVIGDKFLTDYLFAKNIGADFIMVKRKMSGKESLFVKMTYLFDDLFYKIAKRIWRIKII